MEYLVKEMFSILFFDNFEMMEFVVVYVCVSVVVG